MNSLIEKIDLELSLYGFSVLHPKESDERQPYIEKFQKEMKNIMIDYSSENKYNGGDLFIVKKENLTIDKNIEQYLEFHKSNIEILKRMKNTKGYHLYTIFRTLDTKDSNHIAQVPHFDKQPTLKFMLYINDINKNNGAFCLSPGSHKWVENLYGKYRYFQKFNNYEHISRSIPDSIIKRLEPVEGKAGTLIIFYTNCIHHQGIVSEGDCKIVRSHYRKKFFNLKFKSNRF